MSEFLIPAFVPIPNEATKHFLAIKGVNFLIQQTVSLGPQPLCPIELPKGWYLANCTINVDSPEWILVDDESRAWAKLRRPHGADRFDFYLCGGWTTPFKPVLDTNGKAYMPFAIHFQDTPTTPAPVKLPMRYFIASYLAFSGINTGNLKYHSASLHHMGTSWPSYKYSKERTEKEIPAGFIVAHVSPWVEVKREQFVEIFQANGCPLPTLPN
jgi:hypothetical protein